MEELQAALKGYLLIVRIISLSRPIMKSSVEEYNLVSYSISATQSVPTFVKDIVGERVHEEETVVFEALYSGNPAPGETYYFTIKQQIFSNGI